MLVVGFTALACLRRGFLLLSAYFCSLMCFITIDWNGKTLRYNYQLLYMMGNDFYYRLYHSKGNVVLSRCVQTDEFTQREGVEFPEDFLTVIGRAIKLDQGPLANGKYYLK